MVHQSLVGPPVALKLARHGCCWHLLQLDAPCSPLHSVTQQMHKQQM